MTTPSKQPSIAPIVVLFALPFVLPLPLLVLGLVLPSLAVVYLSIAASLSAIPCWIAAIVLLVRRSSAQRTFLDSGGTAGPTWQVGHQ